MRCFPLLFFLVTVSLSFAANIMVQSHRGAGVLAPENTVEAFELGWKLGTIPEADVRTTKDGVIVAFHDANFARVVHGVTPELKDKGVRDLTFAELSQLEVGAETGDATRRRKVLPMSEFFALMKGKPERLLYLDIKEVDLKRLAAEVQEYGVTSQVIFASTKLPLLREWKTLLPDGQTLLWMGGTEAKLSARIQELKDSNFAGVTQLQLHVKKDAQGQWAPGEPFVKNLAAVLKTHKVLFQALPWGADDAAIYLQLMDWGVESFATDHPDVVMPALRARLGQTP